MYAQNPNLFRELGLGTASERSTSMKSSSQVAGSIRSDRFDYMENVETTSSLSTPPSTGYWESPFNQESLGDTVIHLDKVNRNFNMISEYHHVALSMILNTNIE